VISKRKNNSILWGPDAARIEKEVEDVIKSIEKKKNLNKKF
jgi:hypothetical protein